MTEGTRWLWLVVTGLWVCGCGSSGAKPGPAQPTDNSTTTAEPSELDRLLAEQPETPYETVARTGYRSVERCGQGPYRFEADALGARYAEKIKVYACGPRAISGNYRMTIDYPHSEDYEYARSFGWDRANDACVAGEADRVAITGQGAGTGGKGATAGATDSGGSSPSRALAADPIALEPVDDVPEQCQQTELIVEYGFLAEGDHVGLAAGSRLIIDVWSDEPNDLGGVVFVVEQLAVPADMTPERWSALREANRSWYERYQALAVREEAAGRLRTVDDSVKAPPPPAKKAEDVPPRPSKNARWIPGYWYYDHGAYHWLAGFWRVPPSDIEKKLTVRAPEPPPAPKAEVRPDRPARAAVWTPGHWQWNGKLYVWVAGAWRIPPAKDQVWKPATWIQHGAEAVFSPGGWSIRLGR